MSRRRRFTVILCALLIVHLSAMTAAGAGPSTLRATLPQARDGTSAVWAGSVAYVFGGAAGGSASKDIVKFDPATDSVSTVASLATAVTYSAAVWTGSVAYVFGGRGTSGYGGGTNAIQKFDPSTSSVASLSAKLASAVSGHVAVWTGTHAFIFGGMGGQGELSTRIQKFDPSTEQAEVLGATLPAGLMEASAAYDGRYVYILGGLAQADRSYAGTAEVLRFDPQSNALKTMNPLSYPKVASAAFFDGKEIYLVGGALSMDAAGDDSIVKYGILADASSTVPFSMNSAVAYPSAVWGGDAAYIFGGRDGSRRIDAVQRFVPSEAAAGSGSISGPGGGVTVNLGGKVVGPDGAAAAGVPVLLLSLANGLFEYVGGGAPPLTGSDGSYQISNAQKQPTHVAVYQDGHIHLKPVDGSGQPVPDIQLKQNARTVKAEEVATLATSYQGTKVFPVSPPQNGSTYGRAQMETFAGVSEAEIQAPGSGLQLMVTALTTQALGVIREPPGELLRLFGVGLADGSFAEVDATSARFVVDPPAGAAPGENLSLFHYHIAKEEWSVSAPFGQTNGKFRFEVASFSLFGLGRATPKAAVNEQLLLVAGAVLALGVVGVTAWKMKLRGRSRGPARAATKAAVERPLNIPRSAVPLKENDFIVSGLSFQAQGKQLLRDLSFGFQRGQILALLGPSGSGKSTLLKCIIGENEFDGEINAFGYKPRVDRDALKRLVGYVSQETQLYPDMTVKENIAYFGKQYGLKKDQVDTMVPYLIHTLGLEERTDTAVKVLSGGQQRRASIAATLIASPALLILDEPTSGLDPITRRNLWKFIRQANRELGVSVIVTTHFLDETEYADRVVILVRGTVVVAGGPQEMIRSLPGGGKVVLVELQNTSTTIEQRIRAAAAELQTQGLVKKLDITGFTVRFFVDNPQAANRALLDALQAADVPVKSLSAEDATMEDAFVHYAGEAWQEPDK